MEICIYATESCISNYEISEEACYMISVYSKDITQILAMERVTCYKNCKLFSIA
jgi:hypothetical protein